MGLMALFTYLKIILLQCFQFSISTKEVLSKHTLGQIMNVELFILLFGKQIPLLLRRIVDKQFLYYVGPNRIEICVEYRTKYNYSRSSHTHTKKFKNKCFFTFFTFHPLTFSNFFYLRIKIKSCFS